MAALEKMIIEERRKNSSSQFSRPASPNVLVEDVNQSMFEIQQNDVEEQVIDT